MRVKSFRIQLIIAISLIVICTISLLTYISLQQMHQTITEQNIANFHSISKEVHFNIAQIFDRAVNTIKMMSHDTLLVQDNATKGELEDLLGEYHVIHTEFEDILVLNDQGRVVASATYHYSGNWRYRDVFIDAMKGNYSISRVYQLSNPVRYVISILGPVTRSDGSKAVIGIQMNIAEISSISDHVRIGETGFSFVIDEDYRIISHPEDNLKASMVDDTIRTQIENNNSKLSFTYLEGEYSGGYYRHSDDECLIKSWTVITTQRNDEMFASLSTFSERIFICAFIIISFSLIYAIFFSNVLIRPLLDMKKRIVRIANGDFSFNAISKGFNELNDLTDAFNRMSEELKESKVIIERTNQDLQQMVRMKDEFINQLGHDLKNPLGPLVSLLPLLKKHEQDPKYQEMLDIIERNTMYMKNLVSKTLTLARLRSPTTEFHFKSVNVEPIVVNIVEMNKLLFSENHISVSIDVPSSIIVSVDTMQFEELLTNLLNNAVKYSNGPGEIYIAAKEEGDMVTISISDTGIGMSKEQLSHVFDEFYKADPSRHDFDSSGLGLAIVKRIVEKHGGKIWVESPGLGKGSTFYFTLSKSQSIIQHTDIQDLDDMDYEVTKRIDILMDTRLKE